MIHGICISQAFYLQKEKQCFHKHLDNIYRRAHEKFRTDPTPLARQLIDKARFELDLFLTDSTEKFLLRSRYKIYTKANKPDTFLALALHKIHHTVHLNWFA